MSLMGFESRLSNMVNNVEFVLVPFVENTVELVQAAIVENTVELVQAPIVENTVEILQLPLVESTNDPGRIILQINNDVQYYIGEDGSKLCTCHMRPKDGTLHVFVLPESAQNGGRMEEEMVQEAGIPEDVSNFVLDVEGRTYSTTTRTEQTELDLFCYEDISSVLDDDDIEDVFWDKSTLLPYGVDKDFLNFPDPDVFPGLILSSEDVSRG